MFKKLKCGIMAVLVCSALLSGCGDSPPSDSVTETVTEQTTIETTAKYTEEELEQTIAKELTLTKSNSQITSEPLETTSSMFVTIQEATKKELTDEEITLMKEMPEIVFVFSHYKYAEQNIVGFYVTKDGNIKMYDFRNKDESISDVTNVIDELETAVCDELESYTTIKTEDLKSIPEHKMIEYYKTLLQINKNSEIVIEEKYTDNFEGIGKFYGIRYNQNKEREIITLTGWGYFYDVNTDPSAESIAIYNVLENVPYKLDY